MGLGPLHPDGKGMEGRMGWEVREGEGRKGRGGRGNKNLCGRDGRTICDRQCVPKSTSLTLAVDQNTLPMATITGRTDRQTDRQSATQYAAPY